MTTIATLLVKLGIEAGDYDKGLGASVDKTESSIKRLSALSANLSKAGNALSLGLTLPLVAVGTAAIKAASDTTESLSKMQAVFGTSSDSIEQFAATSATSLRMSRQAAYEAAGTFGNLFTSMGMGRPAAADMSKGLLQLAADLGSFNNLPTTEVFEKLRAGMVGEVEPLRVLGVNLTAAAVEAEAVRLGFEKVGTTFSNTALMTARYNLIMRQTTNAQGDAARTAGTLAGQTAIAKAELQDAAAKLGEHLIPMAATAIGKLNSLADAFNNLPKGQQDALVDTALGIAGIGVAAGPTLKVLGGIVTAIKFIVAAGAGIPVAVGAAVIGSGLLVDKKITAGGAALLAQIEMQHAEIQRATDALREAEDTYQGVLAGGDQRMAPQLKAVRDEQLAYLNDLKRNYDQSTTALHGYYAAAGNATLKDIGAKNAIEALNGSLNKSVSVSAKAAAGIEGIGDAATDTATAVAKVRTELQNMQGQALLSQFGDVPDWAERQGMIQSGILNLPSVEQYQSVIDTQIAAQQHAADEARSAYQQAFDKVKGYAESMLDSAQSKLEGLLSGTKLENLPGGVQDPNGPFKKIYQAADIAAHADKPGKDTLRFMQELGLNQEQATQIVNDFRQGLITEQVKALIDIPMLQNQVAMQAMAEKLKAQFAEEIARGAGLDSEKVTQGLLGVSVDAKGVASVAGLDSTMSSLIDATGKTMIAKAPEIEKVGANFITSLGKGMESAKKALCDTAVGIADAMLKALAERLNVKITPAAAVPPAVSQTAPPTPPTGGVKAQGMSVMIQQTFPPGTPAETRQAAASGARAGLLAADQLTGLA